MYKVKNKKSASIYLLVGLLVSTTIFAQSQKSPRGIVSGIITYLLDDDRHPCVNCINTTRISVVVIPSSVNENNGNNIANEYQLTFSSNGMAVQSGQFANGDYWVSPAEGENYIDIINIAGSGEISGSINPQLESHGIGNGSKNYGSYDGLKNIVGKLPLRLNQDSSIVLATVRDESATSPCDTSATVGECIDSYLAVTFLTTPPADGGVNTFRPPLTTSSKPLLTWSDLDLSKMVSNELLTAPTEQDYERIRRKWSHTTDVLSIWDSNEDYYSEGGRAFRAQNMVDDYSAGQARSWYDDLFMMMASSADRNSRQWKKAFASMFSFGLDNYHVIHSASVSRHYGSGAGQHLGVFPTSVWATHLIKDASPYASYRTALSLVSSGILDDRNIAPNELDQINIEGGNGPRWGDARTASPPIMTAWADLFNSGCYDGSPKTCNPTGSKAQKDPYGIIDGPMSKPGSSYMGVTFGPMESLVALACMSPGMADIINYQPLIEYVDRVKLTGVIVAGDICAPPPDDEDPDCNPYKSVLQSPGSAASYQAATGCNSIGQDWGPDPSDPQNLCIVNNSNGRTGQSGRFSQLGSNFNVNNAYVSPQVTQHYASFRGSSSSCTD